MRDEHLSLLVGQLIERFLQRLEQRRSRVFGLRSSIARRQDKIQPAVALPLVVAIRIGLRDSLLLLSAEAVDDAVTCDLKQPPAGMLDRGRKPKCFDERECSTSCRMSSASS